MLLFGGKVQFSNYFISTAKLNNLFLHFLCYLIISLNRESELSGGVMVYHRSTVLANHMANHR